MIIKTGYKLNLNFEVETKKEYWDEASQDARQQFLEAEITQFLEDNLEEIASELAKNAKIKW